MNRLGVVGDPDLRTVGEDRIVEYLLVGGWAYEIRNGGRQAATEATRAALARWVEAGLPVSPGAAGERRYDPVEVLNFMKWVSLCEGDPFWMERFLTTSRRLVLDQDADPASRPASGEMPFRLDKLQPRQVSVVLTRNFNLSSMKPGAPVRLRLSLPLEGAALDGLDLRIDPPADMSVQFSHIPGRLEARLEVPADRKVSLTYRANFRARAGEGGGKADAREPGELDAGALALYTRPSEGFIRVTPRIVDLARELAGRCRSRLDAVHAFWNHIMDRMMFGAIHYHEIDMTRPVDWLLDNIWTDCQLGSALLVSLCRAVDIPARIVGGHMLYPLAPNPHYWPEIWLDGTGWIPFDLASWDLAAGGRDRHWRDFFAGSIDYRMTTQCFPRDFVGPMSLRLPERWHLLTRINPDGLRVSLGDAASGETVYSDDISVRMGSGTSP